VLDSDWLCRTGWGLRFVRLSTEKMGTKGLIAEVAPGVFVSKTKIIICGVILLVLLILVIVLGALLGHARSQLSGILLSI